MGTVRYTTLCTVHTTQGYIGTGNHCFLLCPSRSLFLSLSLSLSLSRTSVNVPVWLEPTDFIPGPCPCPGPGPVQCVWAIMIYDLVQRGKRCFSISDKHDMIWHEQNSMHSEHHSSEVEFYKLHPGFSMWPLGIDIFLKLLQMFGQSNWNGIYLNNLALDLLDKSASVFISCHQHWCINAWLKWRWLD